MLHLTENNKSINVTVNIKPVAYYAYEITFS